MITPLQHRVLCCLRGSQDAGERITLDEIANRCGLYGKSAAHRILQCLIERGRLRQIGHGRYEIIGLVEPIAPRPERFEYFKWDKSTKSLVPLKGRNAA